MELSNTDLFAATVAASAIWMCGLSSVQSMLRGLAIQAIALAAICVVLGRQEFEPHYYLLAIAVFAVKAAGIPLYLSWAASRLGVRRDRGTFVGPAVGLGLGCVALVVGLFVGNQLSVPTVHSAGAAGMAVVLVLVGMLLMIGRRLALSQLVGLLTLENGIFLFGLTQTRGMPLMVEMGAVFEILVGVLIGGLVLFRLNRSFEHIDVTTLRGLRR